MYRLLNSQKTLFELVDAQFKVIGLDVKFEDIENGVKVKEGKKEKVHPWWEVYFFENEEQESQWLLWVKEQIIKRFGLIDEREIQSEVNFINLVYGMNVKLKKEGQLF